MAGTMVKRAARRWPSIVRWSTRGQVLPLLAVALAGFILLVIAALDYGAVTLRVMHAVAAADMAAHAGAMRNRVLPDGRIVMLPDAEARARQVFLENRIPYARFRRAECGVMNGRRPWCEVTVEVEGAFWTRRRIVKARAVLAEGVTREGQ